METFRALIADDCEGQRRMLATVMTAAGLDIDFAMNGAEAVTAARRTRYDLIFMDVSMPVMNGFDATRHIRFEERADHRPRTPLYIVTSHDDEEHRYAALKAGADGHIAKPTSTAQLVHVIRRHTVTASGRNAA